MKRSHLIGSLGALSALALGAVPYPARALAARVHIDLWPADQGHLGSDGHRHATMVPADFRVSANRAVTVSITNHDTTLHSMTSSGLGLDAEIVPARKIGSQIVPVTSSFTFTATRPGSYRWFCKEPCDRANGMWAMESDDSGRDQLGFMAGHITVV